MFLPFCFIEPLGKAVCLFLFGLHLPDFVCKSGYSDDYGRFSTCVAAEQGRCYFDAIKHESFKKSHIAAQ